PSGQVLRQPHAVLRPRQRYQIAVVGGDCGCFAVHPALSLTFADTESTAIVWLPALACLFSRPGRIEAAHIRTPYPRVRRRAFRYHACCAEFTHIRGVAAGSRDHSREVLRTRASVGRIAVSAQSRQMRSSARGDRPDTRGSGAVASAGVAELGGDGPSRLEQQRNELVGL